tara:strand:- start:636 stop:1748 length:1113 start_codon:yes stop_codon:yes gene_type:complete
MANVYKPLNESDRVKSRTLLHESIPVTGTISSGTYADNNIKNYAAKIFQSVYDYPYLSSSANHIFDLTAGFSSQSGFSGSYLGTTVTASAKKINIYNQMAQVLVGYDESGSIRRFDRDGDFSTTTDKMNELFFMNFSRLLTKDEVKKGSFTVKFLTGSTVALRNKPGNGIWINAGIKTIGDYGAATAYKVNSPAGEYGILYTSSALPNAASGVGLLYYQAGVAAFTSSIFDGQFGTQAMTTQEGVKTALGFTRAVTASVRNMYVSGNIQDFANGIRNGLNNVSFNNTTELNSTIYFCRAHSSEFNYSTNPTYLSGSKIRVKNNSTDIPVSYATTVGLYSAASELLAVAKLSEPIKKTPSNEATLRVRLDY